MDCTNLDPDSHEILKRITRARWNPKNGIVKITVQGLSDKTGIPWRDVQLLLEDLAVDGFVKYDRELSRVHRVIPCGCEESLESMFSEEPLGSAADDDVPTRSTARGRGVGGSPKGSPSTEGAKERARGRTRAPEAPPTPRRGIDWYVANPSELKPAVLAKYFGQRMDDVRTTRAGFRSVGQVNHSALMGNFSRWIREDEISPIQIVAMIDYFAKHPKLLREGVPAWKVFLAKRELIVRQIVNLMPVEDEGWDAEVLDQDTSDDLGWG